MMHGQVWQNEDPTGWFMSEKLDGFRAFWDGSKLYSRNGNIISSVPEEFTRLFPQDVCLDGELWVGYDQYNTLASIIRKTAPQEEAYEMWKEVKFNVFDAPMHSGTYIERHSFASESISNCGPNICMIPIICCTGFTHLHATLDQIKSKKGKNVLTPCADITFR
uniref:ATP-dependent DNA ligase family profile domain-containing protein n=1 Tax=Arcella intermedia TaxID=1963864 RepID=A0A6B2LJR8_9EUKA